MPYFYVLIGLNSINLPMTVKQLLMDVLSSIQKNLSISAHYYEKLIYLTSPNWLVRYMLWNVKIDHLGLL